MYNLLTLILSDGATLAGTTYGAYILTITCVLMPASILCFAAGAGLAFNSRRGPRRAAVMMISLGAIFALVAVGMVIYPMVFGSTWAFQS